jgi:hypothetical protein
MGSFAKTSRNKKIEGRKVSRWRISFKVSVPEKVTNVKNKMIYLFKRASVQSTRASNTFAMVHHHAAYHQDYIVGHLSWQYAEASF